MIKIENFEEYGIDNAIRGVRLSYKSGDKSDSLYDRYDGEFNLGEKDHDLLLALSKKSDSESTFMRHMMISMDVTAPLMWWKQMDRYSVGKTQLSESTMHTLMNNELTIDDFAHDGMDECICLGTPQSEEWWEITPKEVLQDKIDKINTLISTYKKYKSNGKEIKKEEKLAQIERLVELTLPESYLQKRTITMNYAVFKHIYYDRYSPKKHKMLEWSQFIEEVLDVLEHKEFIDEKLKLAEERNDILSELTKKSAEVFTLENKLKAINEKLAKEAEE